MNESVSTKECHFRVCALSPVLFVGLDCVIFEHWVLIQKFKVKGRCAWKYASTRVLVWQVVITTTVTRVRVACRLRHTHVDLRLCKVCCKSFAFQSAVFIKICIFKFYVMLFACFPCMQLPYLSMKIAISKTNNHECRFRHYLYVYVHWQ